MPSFSSGWGIATAIGIAVGVMVALGVAYFVFRFFNLWLQAWLTGANISFPELVGMYFRRMDGKRHHFELITRAKIMATVARVPITRAELESHHLSNGNVANVVRALICADRAEIPLTFKQAAAIDLAGRNVLEAVQTSVLPRVIDCPEGGQGRMTADGVAKDGIQLRARARVTVKTKLSRLVGGANEKTVIARVGEGIVNTIGTAGTYADVLQNPERISQVVYERGLDSGTAFEILSIDIADIDVGENVGAKLQADQAEADLRKARAQAEQERASAVAREQEMRALVEQNRAELVQQEADVPKALAAAIDTGSMSLMDYYRLRNLQADTEMRTSFATAGEDKGMLPTPAA